jgi:hypothetical protein
MRSGIKEAQRNYNELVSSRGGGTEEILLLRLYLSERKNG